MSGLVFRCLWPALFMAAASIAAPAGAADEYPAKNVRIIVGAAPGGITDVIARLLGDYLARATGARTVVENVAGAGGNIAFAQLAKSAPDGYTLGLASAGNIVINQFLYQNMSFDPLTDLVAAAPIAAAPQLLMVSASSPFRTLGDLADDARKNPGAINYGSAGVGSTPHLSGALFEKLAGLRMTHVPYRGTAPAITDLLGMRLQLVAIGAQPVISFIKDGQLRALAVTDARRLASLPDVPTAAEAGFPGYEVSSWFGLFAPKGTPGPVIEKLDGLVRAMLADPAERRKFTDVSIVPMDVSRADFKAQIDREAKAWGGMIREAGITAN